MAQLGRIKIEILHIIPPESRTGGIFMSEEKNEKLDKTQQQNEQIEEMETGFTGRK